MSKTIKTVPYNVERLNKTLAKTVALLTQALKDLEFVEGLKGEEVSIEMARDLILGVLAYSQKKEKEVNHAEQN